MRQESPLAVPRRFESLQTAGQIENTIDFPRIAKKNLRDDSPLALVRRNSPTTLSTSVVRRNSPTTLSTSVSPVRRENIPRLVSEDGFLLSKNIESTPTSRSWSSPIKNVRLPQIQGEIASNEQCYKAKSHRKSDEADTSEHKILGQGTFKGTHQSLYEMLQKKVIAKVGAAHGSVDKAIASAYADEDAFFRKLKENLNHITSPEVRRKPSIRRPSLLSEDQPLHPANTQQTRSLAMLNEHIQGVRVEAAPRKVSIRRRSSTSHSLRNSISDERQVSQAAELAAHQPHYSPGKPPRARPCATIRFAADTVAPDPRRRRHEPNRPNSAPPAAAACRRRRRRHLGRTPPPRCGPHPNAAGTPTALHLGHPPDRLIQPRHRDPPLRSP